MSRIIAILILGLVGCSANVEPTEPQSEVPAEQPEAEPACTVIGRGEQDLVLKFSDHDIAAPGGLKCVSLGGGVFRCDPDTCGFFGGNCPECPYTPYEGSTGE